ncbi:MAG: tetratricopeptide repeat protein, partial [Verrucomicrobiota bacterium]
MKLPTAIVTALAATLLAAQPGHAQATPRKAIPIAPPGEPTNVPDVGDRPLTSNAEQDLFNYASLVYEKGYHDLAIEQFAKYLKQHPGGTNAEAAWFRLGESHLKQRKHEEAKDCYLEVVKKFKRGPYVPPSSYRLASLYYNENAWSTAEPFFALAHTTTKRPEIRISSVYYRARCLANMKKFKEAIEAYTTAAAQKENNPYREASLLALGRLETDRGNHEVAYRHFKALTTESVRPAVKGEALVKAGLLAQKLNKIGESRELLNQALDLKGADEWKPEAQFHLIEAYYAEENYAAVVKAYRTGVFPLTNDLKPKMYLLVGNALRRLNKSSEAVDLYLNIEQYFPTSPEMLEAGYRKLLCFLKLKTPRLADYAADYVDRARMRDPEHLYIDLALLLQGEALYNDEDFARAADAYGEIRIDNIPEDVRASMLYKWGWSHAESGRPTQAITALTRFIDDYPEDIRFPKAVAKRGLSYKAVEDLTAAERDFNRLLKDYPQAPASEVAYQQLALIKGQQRDFRGLIDAYEGLLKNFPQSKATGEAHFWIGWAHFEERNFKKAIPALEKARKMEASSFFEQASRQLVLANYMLQDVAATRLEVEIVYDSAKPVAIPDQVIAWLGVRLFEQNDMKGAEKYLARASTPEDPGQTKSVVWRMLGEARLRQNDNEDAIVAFDHYLNTRQPNEARARVLNEKAKALIGLQDYASALTVVEEGLELQQQGRVNAQLCLTWGDIALSEKKWEEALKRLVRPAFIFDDEEITPVALEKSAYAHEQLGES